MGPDLRRSSPTVRTSRTAPTLQDSGRHTPTMRGRTSPTMSKVPPTKPRLDMLQGTLDLLVLRTLQWGPQHGHGIGVAIRTSSQDALQLDHGSLYPALHRLEKQGRLTPSGV